jgi:hypothetical protein
VTCGKDYTEKDNFNWSCHYHTGEFEDQGQIWWCCGKKDPKARGCKFQKHINNEEKEKLMENKTNLTIQPHKRKCQCCKGYGHNEKMCPKDPNIRSSKLFDADEEDERILEELTNSKKLNADASILTLNMLTKVYSELGKNQSKNIMSFDDF